MFFTEDQVLVISDRGTLVGILAAKVPLVMSWTQQCSKLGGGVVVFHDCPGKPCKSRCMTLIVRAPTGQMNIVMNIWNHMES